jgi:hypothetical protein
MVDKYTLPYIEALTPTQFDENSDALLIGLNVEAAINQSNVDRLDDLTARISDLENAPNLVAPAQTTTKSQS